MKLKQNVHEISLLVDTTAPVLINLINVNKVEKPTFQQRFMVFQYTSNEEHVLIQPF